MKPNQKKTILGWLIVVGLALLLAGAGAIFVWQTAAQAQSASALMETAQVTTISAVSNVESSGAATAQQSASVYWKTTGTVAAVKVAVGDKVKAGDVLMTLGPQSAPQNVIQAQADLISAQQALDDLLHPSELTIANAKQAMVNAQDALDKAQKDLRNTQNPVGQSLYDTVSDKKLALDTAQANLQLANVDPNVSAYNNAVFITNWHHQFYEDLKAKLDANPGNQELQDKVEQAYNTYQSKLNDQMTLQLKINTDQANKQDAVAKAQKAYNDAVANLNSALKGPDTDALAVAKAKVEVAQASLADAQDKLNKLLNGADPKDIASAQAHMQAAQATVDMLTLKAPFDGEVLVINYQPGDAATPSQAAVVLANRSALHVNVSVDETDIAGIQVGDTAQVTFDPLADLTLDGVVAEINPIGSEAQGLVKYTVRVDLAEGDPRVLLGMTANVNIITDVQENALAVLIEAVQLDDEGEYVSRVNAGGVPERVPVTSGQTQEDLVVVQGALFPGDVVQIPAPQPQQPQGPFGGLGGGD